MGSAKMHQLKRLRWTSPVQLRRNRSRRRRKNPTLQEISKLRMHQTTRKTYEKAFTQLSIHNDKYKLQ